VDSTADVSEVHVDLHLLQIRCNMDPRNIDRIVNIHTVQRLKKRIYIIIDSEVSCFVIFSRFPSIFLDLLSRLIRQQTNLMVDL
jgi:hypothetical protein